MINEKREMRKKKNEQGTVKNEKRLVKNEKRKEGGSLTGFLLYIPPSF
ncbi:MAG: hypothetical protein FWD78_14020 [Treponema sp.]|nr:hypothetical protein [Treponema sp.]